MNQYSTQLESVNKKFPFVTFRNSLISILLAVIVIIFSFVRTSLTSNTFGVDSLGLLTIVLGILPYISGGHNSMASVSASKLYKSFHLKDYDGVNQEIARLKPQYYMFGSFYFIITIAIAFGLPFIANNTTGQIIVGDEHIGQESIEWWQSTLFVLSNAVELFALYFIIPISIILLYIANKSYIYNSINIVLTIVINIVIIVLFLMVQQARINLTFVEMNIIIYCLLGVKSIIILLILFPLRKKHFGWYKYKRLSFKKWKIEKESWQSMFSGYFSQFSTDLISILFLVYSSISVISTGEDHTHDALLRHGNHGGSVEDNFIPSSIYTVFLMVITNIYEIVHCIMDEAIPSVAEHTVYNNQKIKKHFFHRFQVLSLFIAIFTTTTYLLISGMLQPLFLDNNGTHYLNTNILNILVFLLWIPFVVQIFSSMYAHILSMLKMFNKNLIISIINAMTNLVIIAICASVIFTKVVDEMWMYAIFGVIIGSNLIANSISYLLSRKYIKQFISHDNCVNILKSTILSFGYLIVILAIMLPINICLGENFIHLLDYTNWYEIVLISVAIIILNFFVNYINISIFRKNDINYYRNMIKQKIHQEPQQKILAK